jgi:hypothetical protein
MIFRYATIVVVIRIGIGIELVVMMIIDFFYIASITFVGIAKRSIIILNWRNVWCVYNATWVVNILITHLILLMLPVIINIIDVRIPTLIWYTAAIFILIPWIIIDHLTFDLFNIYAKHVIQCMLLYVAADIWLDVEQYLFQWQYFPLLKVF